METISMDTRKVTYNGCRPAKHVGLPLAHGGDPAIRKLARIISFHHSLDAHLLQHSSNTRNTNKRVLTLRFDLDRRLEQHNGAADTDSLGFPQIWQYFGCYLSGREEM